MHAPPRPGPGGNGCPGPPRPRKFSTLPRPAPPHPGKRGRCPAPPRPENYPGARIVANVPTSSKVFGSQKLLTSIFSTKGALRRHVSYNNHPNLTLRLLARLNRPQRASIWTISNELWTNLDRKPKKHKDRESKWRKDNEQDSEDIQTTSY